MSLRAKMLVASFLVLAGILLLAGTCVWGLDRQRGHVEASLREYQALKTVQAAELSTVAANVELHAPQPDLERVRADLRAARKSLSDYKALVTQYVSILPPEIDPAQQHRVHDQTAVALDRLTELLVRMGEHIGSIPRGATPVVAPSNAELQATVGAAVSDLADLLSMCNAFLDRTQNASDHDLRLATTVVAIWAAVIPLVLILATLWQYRRVMVPLQRLRGWSRRVSAGDLSVPYLSSSDREFVELGHDINRMAEELNGFYRKLEEMVAAKSKELARSERLASVGYLAAGVAHEINNPLNIMSGHAELTTRRVENGEAADSSEVLESLRIIRDEAFRCKEITQKLLSLARGGGAPCDVLSMSAIVDDVVKMVLGLDRLGQRRIEVNIDRTDPLSVRANASELKQVLLNLLLNALEALRPAGGLIRIDARPTDEWIQVTISDDGRGMSPATLERVFEPFYTEKRGTVEPGTGLGLSISHAIVTGLGGTLSADSAGVGRGSRFTLRLPIHRPARQEPQLRPARSTRVGQLLGSE